MIMATIRSRNPRLERDAGLGEPGGSACGDLFSDWFIIASSSLSGA
jgi:hypothetical protein